MEKYEPVEIEVITFEAEDIIVTSNRDLYMPEIPVGNK